jgi:AraC-like DNA-binding protein
MRPEVIQFPDGMPVKAFVRNITAYPYHWHQAPEIIYVLKGRSYLDIGGETHLLEKDHIGVINGNEPHRIYMSGEENRLLMVQIDPDFCLRWNPDYRCTFFYCCTSYHEAKTPEKYQILKNHLRHLVYLLNQEPGNKRQADVENCLREILAHLTDNFDYLNFGPGTKAFVEKQAKRFKKIYRQILSFPNQKQGLKAFAQEAGVTLQHLSNDIKDKFGYTFQELLYYSKCQHAARLLLNSEKLIPQIASECGFSDPKYLIKHFKLNYHCTPSEFRKMYKADEETLASQVRYEEIPLSQAMDIFKNFPNTGHENHLVTIIKERTTWS